MERLLAGTDPALVNFELDGYWAYKADHDPAELVAKYPGRFVMVHLKDSTAAPAKEFADVGHGVIDFRKFIASASANGLRYAFVERDVSPDPIASIRGEPSVSGDGAARMKSRRVASDGVTRDAGTDGLGSAIALPRPSAQLHRSPLTAHRLTAVSGSPQTRHPAPASA